MNRPLPRSLALVAVAALLSLPAAHLAAAERSEVPDKYKWDLRALYPSVEAWTAAREKIAGRVPGIAAFQGRLGAAPESLHVALSTMMDLDRDLSRLYTYASQLNDEDQRVSNHLEMREAAERMVVQFRSAAAYVRPEILAIGSAKVRSFLSAEPRLKDYKPYLENILRYEKHTLSAAEEKIAAQAGRFASAGNTIRDLFNNAELPKRTEVARLTGLAKHGQEML